MTESIRTYLKQTGFSLYRTNIPFSELWVKQDAGHARVFMTLDHRKHPFSSDEIIQMQKRLEQKYYLTGCKSVEILFLLLTERLEEVKFYGDLLDGIWFINMPEHRLVMYERAPEDFENLRGILETELELIQLGVNRQVRKKDEKQRIPFTTIGLVLLNILVFLIVERFGTSMDAWFMFEMGAATSESIIVDGQFWRLLTCTFLHFGLSHLGNNMIILGIAGSQVENRIGHARFLLFYTCAGIFASMCSAVWHYHLGETVISAGASGAIYGVLGAILVFTWKERAEEGVIRRCIWMLFFLIYGSINQPQIDVAAHIGGLLFGILVTLVMEKRWMKKTVR